MPISLSLIWSSQQQMTKLMCANLSIFSAYSYALDEDDRVGVFIAGHCWHLIPAIVRLRLWTQVWMEAFQLDCGQSDVHWMCTLAVRLSPLDLWWMMEGVLQFVMSEVVDWEMENCIRTKTQNCVWQPEIESIIAWCVMAVMWLHLES
jgi:hypothetical protein